MYKPVGEVSVSRCPPLRCAPSAIWRTGGTSRLTPHPPVYTLLITQADGVVSRHHTHLEIVLSWDLQSNTRQGEVVPVCWKMC
ncbi:hypothetical protein DPMN_045466 [Dreissena polymorpha]|uniref:Uncharacterized protein n=1 Tax=Dreissena polymorpha TaxID=45954 RepID=A0A9D4D4E9_DREPO|nr:hypothetical protein DPMN_045466 [Dreissena polymorpha]